MSSNEDEGLDENLITYIERLLLSMSPAQYEATCEDLGIEDPADFLKFLQHSVKLREH